MEIITQIIVIPLNGRELRSNALRREFSAGVIGALPAGKLLY
jgi:hypothetical protein